MFDKDIEHPHKTYRFARDSKKPKAQEIKSLCNKLWCQYKDYADTDFLSELSKDFESRFWEMDLTCALINHGYEISSEDEGPDVLLNNKENRIWIEATAPDNGNGPDKVPDAPIPGSPIRARTVPDKQIILRFTSSIVAKFKKYNDYLQNGIIETNEPYIIAINSLKLNCQTDFDPPRIVRTVFPFGSYQMTVNTNTFETVDEGFEYRQSVTKENLEPISIDMFLNPKYSGISAVLFSQADCLNRAKDVTDSFILVHNPYARNPIERGYFDLGIEYFAVKKSNNQFQLHYIDHIKK